MKKVFKIIKSSGKKDKLMIGHYIKLCKEASERIDRFTLEAIVVRYGKKWVKDILKKL